MSALSMAATAWHEIAERVFVLRYAFFDQTIGVVVGRDGVLLIDTRTSHRQGRELLDDLRRLTAQPVRIVVNTHLHSDHCFGNRVFRPAAIWGHVRCASGLEETGADQIARLRAAIPDMADELAEIAIDPPDRTFEAAATISIGGRAVELRHLGRGHTDGDIVISVPDAGVLFAGDLLENGAPPSYGDAYPLDWPTTAAALIPLADGLVAPGHGEVADRAFVERQAAELRVTADLVRAVHARELAAEEATALGPFGAETTRLALERGFAQLAGTLP